MDEFSTIPIDIEGAGGVRQDGGRAAALVILRGPELGRRFPLGPGPKTVGRLADVAIFIHHQSLSRRHCEVEPTVVNGRAAYVLRDLNSTNGTYVNGRRIEHVELQDGDKLSLGDVVLKFMLLDTVEENFHHEVNDRIRVDRGTGLLNLATFYDDLDKVLYRARAEGVTVAVIMMDVDGLKQVNDVHGHQLGTTVIHTVARQLRTACDALTAAAAVYGGDEFVTYLWDVPEAGALAMVETLRAEVAALEFPGPTGGVARVTLSAGIAEFPRDGTVREVLVRRADIALYAAKRAGKNRAVPFRSHMEADAAGSGPGT